MRLIELMSYGLARAKPLSEVTLNLPEKFQRFPHFPLVAQLACNSEKNKANIDKTIEGSKGQGNSCYNRGGGRGRLVVTYQNANTDN